MLNEMMDVYCKQVECVLELGLALCQPGLTQAQGQQLERVHICTFYFILGEEHSTYRNAVEELECETVSERRTKLCFNFAKI